MLISIIYFKSALNESNKNLSVFTLSEIINSKFLKLVIPSN
jgi:hypothetical protein